MNNVAASSYVKPYGPQRAVNGDINPLSRWLCNTLPGWLSVDLGVPYYVSRWVVKQMPLVAGWYAPGYCLSDYSLQGSNDNNTFVNIDSVLGNTTANFDKTLTSPQRYRYFRVNVTKGLNSNTKLASIMEFELYGAKSSYLTGLVVSSGALNPVFAKTTYSYTAPSVPNTTSSITITPTAEDAGANIKVKGVVVGSGQPTTVNLNVGSNAIDVVVTGADGVSQHTYIVNVTRVANPYLKALTITGNVSGAITLGQTFDPKNVFTYTALADYDDTSATVVLTADDPSATISVSGGAFNVSPVTVPVTMSSPNNYDISVVVKGADGVTTQAYSVTVTRPSSPYLTGVISLTTFPPTNITVVRNTTNYSATVTTNSIKIKGSLEDTAASMALSYGVILPTPGPVTNAPMTNNTPAPASPVTLAAGTTTRFTITVTSAFGGSVKKYNVDVTR